MEDDASLYQGNLHRQMEDLWHFGCLFLAEFYPPLVDGCWMGQSAQNPSSSFWNSPSPPPYTPLPLSGHVTLMLGQPSPAKRRNSIQSTRVDSYPGPPVGQEQETEAAPGSILESSLRRERRESGTSRRHSREVGEGEIDLAAAAGQPSADLSSTLLPDSTRTADYAAAEQEATVEQSSFPANQPVRLDVLSSSFPSARPPSPFPRSRSLSFQLPPLRTIQHPREPQPLPPPELSSQQQLPFRLPPLSPLDSSETHGSRKRARQRSHSCHLQTSTLLTSLQEQSVAVIQ